MGEKKTINLLNRTKTSYLESLVEAINDYDNYSDMESLYQFSDSVTKDLWQIGETFVISTPRKKYHSSHMRMLWNKEEGKKWVLQTSKDEELTIEKFENASQIKDQDGIVFYKGVYLCKFGDEVDQEFWCGFPAQENLDISLYYQLLGFLKRSFKVVKHWHKMNSLSTLIYIDDVTGLFNQRKLMMDIDECIRKYTKYSEMFSILFLDLDHFKSVNDGHGHMVGTKVLMHVGDLLKDVVRDTDMIYRYGGDEFVIILQDADPYVSNVVGQRILKAFKKKEFELSKDEKHYLSSSIGIATYPTHAKTKEEILSLADKMMYEAKNDGRGQVRLATELFDRKK